MGRLKRATPGAKLNAGPGQLQALSADETKFVICDQPIDITYIRLRHGWMYLVAMLDWYSRYVVSWELDQTLEIDFVLAAAQRALAVAQPGIVNSDQGSHFTSGQYLSLI